MYLHWTRRTRTFNVSILSIQKRTMNKNLCQLCPNIMPTIIVTLGQRWANVILKIFWRWANVAPTCWANVGTLCTYNVGPTLKANVGPTKWTMLAQRWANVCVLSGYTVIIKHEISSLIEGGRNYTLLWKGGRNWPLLRSELPQVGRNWPLAGARIFQHPFLTFRAFSL